MNFDYFKFLRQEVFEKQWKCQLPCGREEMMCGFLNGIYSSSCLHAKGITSVDLCGTSGFNKY